jgi:acyl-coenzyme A thioesterase PaaI-like protein
MMDFLGSAENRCFACGPGNPQGMHMHFTHEGGTVRSTFRPADWQEGWKRMVHGGILTTALDEAMAYVMLFAGFQAFTARLEIRFRNPAAAHDELEVEARLVHESRRLADVEAVIRRGSEIISEASGRYVKIARLDGGAATQLD